MGQTGVRSDEGHPWLVLAEAGGGSTLAGMNTLAEVEAAVPQLSAEELAELERLVRNARLTKTKVGGRAHLTCHR